MRGLTKYIKAKIIKTKQNNQQEQIRTTMRDLQGQFTEEVLLPSVNIIMDDKLRNYPTKDDMDLKLTNLKNELLERVNSVDNRANRIEIKVDNLGGSLEMRFERLKEEIISAFRLREETNVQFRVLVTDIIKRHKLATPEELKLLEGIALGEI